MTTFMYGMVGGQQRRHAENVGFMLFKRFEVVLDRIVDTQVDHLESGTFQHHGDQVLADVVDVTP